MISTQVQIKEAQLKDEADREKRRRAKAAAKAEVHEISEGGFDLDDMIAQDDIEEDEENIPPPPPQIPVVRPTKRVVNVNHTPRVFPTPMRESKLKEENAWVQNCVEIKIYGAFVLNRRVDLHAIDATSARWRGDAGSSPLDGASTAASSSTTRLTG